METLTNAPDLVLTFKLENADKTIAKIQQIHIDHMIKALRLAADNYQTLQDFRQAFIVLQWETDKLIDQLIQRNHNASR